MRYLKEGDIVASPMVLLEEIFTTMAIDPKTVCGHNVRHKSRAQGEYAI